ncbi:hypothetical protein [Paracoccus sp. S-4012]|uniref:hypothetical protein n=1 Tax=Paracoccus sp. S-4012 TaxID=2665648 RepID=UPI0012B08E09|nr:hypothetical protein [Paracoccus sp. S-4012]
MKQLRMARLGAVAVGALVAATSAQAEIDGHGPDAWRVTGVAANDVLNGRMGPGTNYPVVETFAHDERGMQQITCVPFYNAQHYSAMTQAQVDALPPRWCLMRDTSLSKAGWVAQRYITPDGAEAITQTPTMAEPYAADANIDPVAKAQDLVREVYERQFQSENGNYPSPFDPSLAHQYFADDIVALLASGELGAHPLYGAQDFDGSIGEPQPDADHPMLRGMITIHVDFANFGQPQRATYYLRADTTKPGTPLRIFKVEHDGWSYP